MKSLIIMVIVAVVLGASLGSAQAQGSPTPSFLYSVKFVCGLQTLGSPAFAPPKEPPVKPGNYATAVNIHNFHNGPNATVEFCKKAVVALPERILPRGPVSPIKFDALGPDQALEVDCTDIASLFPAGTKLPPFIKGFVEINSPVELSVTAVYTAQTCRDPQLIKKGADPDAIIPFPGFCRSLGELDLEVVPQNHFAGDQCNPT